MNKIETKYFDSVMCPKIIICQYMNGKGKEG